METSDAVDIVGGAVLLSQTHRGGKCIQRAVMFGDKLAIGAQKDEMTTRNNLATALPRMS